MGSETPRYPTVFSSLNSLMATFTSDGIVVALCTRHAERAQGVTDRNVIFILGDN